MKKAAHRKQPFEERPIHFYLGRVVGHEFRLPSRKQDLALRAIHDFAKRTPRPAGEKLDVAVLSKLASARTLDFCFELFDCELQRNADGDITNVMMGGDMWAFELLAAVGPHVSKGSWFLIEDDQGRFWKLAFDGRRSIPLGLPEPEKR